MRRADAAPPGGALAADAPAAVLGFLFDPNRCTGCAACSLACSTENELGWGTSWRHVVSFNPERRPGVPSFHLSLACNHCQDAPCVTQCPTRAIRRDPATGAVLVREDACIGCRYCAWVCPYDAPRFDHDRGVMTKCTLCHHRLVEGREPACVEACPTAALGYGGQTGLLRLPGFPEEPFRPRIRFAPLRRATPPESTWSLPPQASAAFAPPGPGAEAPTPGRLRPVTLTFRGEWPLWLFTSGVAALVAWVMAALAGGVPASLPAFLGAAAALLGVSTLHLGRPARAWRALANLPGSRLSREIAAVSAFLGAAALWLAWGGGGYVLLPGAPGPALLGALGSVAALLGALALWQMDRVYDPVRPWPGRLLHSGDTLLVAPLLATALLRLTGPYVVVALLTAGALARRLPPSDRAQAGAAGVRLASLALAPLVWSASGAGWGAALVAVGALADRADLYRSAAITRPSTLALEEAAGGGR
ncbi:MAG: hypothetical protein AMXMBFR53_01080 [Gemmatimonadota bacterium]